MVADTAADEIWRPENYSRKFFGPTRLRKALSLSLNLVSVRLLRAIGTDFAIEHLGHFGFDRERLPEGLSLALGAASLTPLEVVAGYAIFANGGYRVEPYLIASVEDADGRTVEHARPATVCSHCLTPLPAENADAPRHNGAERVISAENAFLMNSLMRQVVLSGTARRALELNRNDLAGKTGTTNNFNDAWFSGFNADVATTVWVGFDKPSDLGRGEAGSKAALPIWIDYMAVALDGIPERPLLAPDSIVSTYVHADSGQAASPGDPSAYEEYFIAGTEPTATLGGAAGLDRGGQAAVRTAAPSGSVTEGLF